MAGKQRFEEQLAALEELRHQKPAGTAAPLRKALAQRNNYLAAKAADIAAEQHLTELIPDLAAAFDRFFVDPAKTDPQCWAKNAISRALAALEFDDPGVYLRGMRHTQPEPVWGGNSDTATTLRGTCALALVACRGLPENELLASLLELLGDKEKPVRVEAAHAVAQVGSRAAALLLRLRAVLGKDEPEVLGACYAGILSIEGTGAVGWVSRFLGAGDDAAAEAALAMADTRSGEALAALRERYEQEHDAWFQGVLLAAMGLTRQEAAFEYLLQLVRKESRQAEAAVEAILWAMPAEEIIKRLEALVADKPGLAKVLAAQRRAAK